MPPVRRTSVTVVSAVDELLDLDDVVDDPAAVLAAASTTGCVVARVDEA